MSEEKPKFIKLEFGQVGDVDFVDLSSGSQREEISSPSLLDQGRGALTAVVEGGKKLIDQLGQIVRGPEGTTVVKQEDQEMEAAEKEFREKKVAELAAKKKQEAEAAVLIEREEEERKRLEESQSDSTTAEATGALPAAVTGAAPVAPAAPAITTPAISQDPIVTPRYFLSDEEAEKVLQQQRDLGRVLTERGKVVEREKNVLLTKDKVGYCASLRISNKQTPYIRYKGTEENYFFILTDCSENFASRFEIFPTKRLDYINFFGEDTLIWSYSGATLDGDTITSKRGFTSGDGISQENWYHKFSDFMITNLGVPQRDIKNLVVVLEYEEYVRMGYLLNFAVQKNSNNRKLVNFTFTMAIHDFYRVELAKVKVADTSNG